MGKDLVKFGSAVLSPGQAGLHVALLKFGFGLDVLRVIVAVLVHHHPIAAEVVALGRGELVACTTLDYLNLTGQILSSRIYFIQKGETHQDETSWLLNKPAASKQQTNQICSPPVHPVCSGRGQQPTRVRQ